MIKPFQFLLLLPVLFNSSCQEREIKKQTMATDSVYAPGSFGYDKQFLSQHDQIVVLKSADSSAMIIVSPKYQAKVFTSSADGEKGMSFGWVNYKAFVDSLDPHMNAYGGENRFWLGPEGGRFSLFFKPGAAMEFINWKTPAAFDSESWQVENKSDVSVKMQKEMHLVNYKGTELSVKAERTISMLGNAEIITFTGTTSDTSVKMVGYQTDNVITNTGAGPWTEQTGAPCIWMLDMFKPSPSTVIVVPFTNADVKPFNEFATTSYFGQIPDDRVKHTANTLFFKADGKSRGKLGIAPHHAKPVAGSYDAEHQVLTIIQFDVDSSAKYLNQEWNTKKPSFSGDAVNAYNDGPLANGTQMGPFYEIESVSPAAFLKSGETLRHRHRVFHFTGPENSLNGIARKLLGVSLAEIKQQF